MTRSRKQMVAALAVIGISLATSVPFLRPGASIAPLVTTAEAPNAGPSFTLRYKQVERVTELEDGSVVYVFEDGAMGMIDRYGHPAAMPQGTIMRDKEGQAMLMTSDAVRRVEAIKRNDADSER